MGKRQTFTEAQLSRALRVAEKHGKVAVQTHIGIAFVDPATIAQTAPEESSVDDWFRQHGEDHGERH